MILFAYQLFIVGIERVVELEVNNGILLLRPVILSFKDSILVFVSFLLGKAWRND